MPSTFKFMLTCAISVTSYIEGGNTGKRQRFQLLALDIKLMLGNAPHAIDELFAYSTKHEIEEDRWSV